MSIRETHTPTTPGQVRRSETAEIVCAQRAAETLRPRDRRLVDDPYARHFVTQPLRRALIANRVTSRLTLRVFDRLYPGFMAIVLLRNRWYEDVLARCLADGTTQVVLLGAGYDTSAWRLALGDATLFEVDAPPTQAAKRAVMEDRGPPSAAALRWVPCDFERDALPERLVAHGFDPAVPALFVWYGVSFFLTAEAVAQTVRDVADLSAPGSTFLWDHLDPAVVDGTTHYPGAIRARAAVAARGEPYTFGLTPTGAADLLLPHGFRVETEMSMTRLARRYAGTHGFPYSTDDFFRVVTARRDGEPAR
jgi:methyltransferase (TIGR00027 family)